MCHCNSVKFDKEELAELGWQEVQEPPPSYEELERQYLNYQYLTYKELFMLVEDAGGVLIMTHYTHRIPLARLKWSILLIILT